MMEYILCSTGVLSLVTFYIIYKKGKDTLFDRVCCFYLLYVFVHISFSIVSYEAFLLKDIEIAGLPLVFGYGAFFYAGLKSLTKNSIVTKYIYLNFFPLLLFALIYIVLVSNADLNSRYFYSFYITESIIVVISLFGYAFWAMQIMRPSTIEKAESRLTLQLVKTGAFSIVTMALFFAGAAIGGLVLGENVEGDVTMLVLYSGIFVSVLLAFIYTVNNTIVYNSVNEKINLNIEDVVQPDNELPEVIMAVDSAQKENQNVEQQTVVPVQKYNKSALSTVVLHDYKEKLDRLITIDNVYLDNELTLEALAKKMKMPMHHLTQLFNVHLGENFNQYINRYRVDYAKSVLEDNEEALSIEQIAFNSGFNSKVSFNRHFKALTGKTPKEYAQLNKTLKKD